MTGCAGPRARARRRAGARSVARSRSPPRNRGRRRDRARSPRRRAGATPPARSTRDTARTHWLAGCDPAAAATARRPPRWRSRSTSVWPVLDPRPGEPSRDLARRSPRPSDTRSPSRDERPSPLRCAAPASPAAPAPPPARASARSRRSSGRGNHTGSRTVNVSSAPPPYGRFSGVHAWPVLGVHRGGSATSFL